MLEYILAAEKPMTWPLRYWPVILVAFIVSVIATPLCEKIAIRLGIVDKPDALVKTHKKATPYLGGIAIFVGVTVGILTGICCIPEQFTYAGLQTARWLFGILAASTIVCVVGCVDDITNIKPWQKVIGQTAAAIILVACGIRPALPGLFDFIVHPLVVIVFVLGATNSLNLLDGLDGLCAGVTMVMAGALLLLATLAIATQDVLTAGDSVRVVISLALLGGVCGFLPFNYPRRAGARIFMGDTGSLLLGLIMAAMMILFSEKTFQFWMASVAIFGLPILDTTVAFARRIINKRPLFVPDRGHIYDQMMDRGLSLRKTVNLCYGLTAAYALVGLAVSQMPLDWAIVTCAGLAAISLLVVWRKGYLEMTGLRGATRKNQESDLSDKSD